MFFWDTVYIYIYSHCSYSIYPVDYVKTYYYSTSIARVTIVDANQKCVSLSTQKLYLGAKICGHCIYHILRPMDFLWLLVGFLF